MKRLEIKNKSVYAPLTKKLLIENINFSLEENERVALIGKNGVGKTTFVENLFNYWNDDFNLKNNFSSMSLVSQDIVFFGRVEDLINDECAFHNIKPKTKLWLKYFELEGKEKLGFVQLSGGEQQKLKLLLAIINKPDLIIVDELATFLDYGWKTEVIELLNKLYHDKLLKTMLTISHNAKEIAGLTDKYYLIEKQKLHGPYYWKEKNLDAKEKEIQSLLQSLS